MYSKLMYVRSEFQTRTTNAINLMLHVHKLVEYPNKCPPEIYLSLSLTHTTNLWVVFY